MTEINRIEYKIEVIATITPVERIETPLRNKVALREVVINTIVNNYYSFEVPPKFEILPDRLEITSVGRLSESLSKEEFFNSISIPRNKELMRVCLNLKSLESLGSSIPCILKAYEEEWFKFADNFIRLTLYDYENIHVKKLVSVLTGKIEYSGLQWLLFVTNKKNFEIDYLNQIVNNSCIKSTIPDKFQ